jgi:hypothetical protein
MFWYKDSMPKPQPKESHDELIQLIEGLSLDADTVLEDASKLPTLFLKAADYRVQKMRQAVQAEMKLDTIRAEAEIEIRNSAVEAGEKITEGHIKSHLILNPDVVQATEKSNEAEAQQEYGKLMLEAYRVKRDCLRAVSDLTAAERAMERITGMNTGSLKEAREKVKAKYPGKL